MKILVITGGVSSERKISLMSATEVKKALESKGHIVTLFDLKKGYAPIKKLSIKFDCIFPVIHGEEGEGGKLHKFLETLNRPYVGGDWRGFKTGWYKLSFKKYCSKNNILTSPWVQLRKNSLKSIRSTILKFGIPAVLKTSNGGSSREVMILKDKKDFSTSQFKTLINSDAELLLEKYLQGIEVTAAVLDTKALPLVEIRPKEGEWFDYKTKYWGDIAEIPFAPSIPNSIQEKIKKIAVTLHKDLKLGHYSRIDFIVVDNNPYVLEINVIPGLTASSLFPKAGAAVGLNFPELMEKLIFLATTK